MVKIAIPYAYTRMVCTIRVRYEIRVWYTTYSYGTTVRVWYVYLYHMRIAVLYYYCLQATYSYSYIYSQHSIAIYYLRSWIISTVGAVFCSGVFTRTHSDKLVISRWTIHIWPAPKVALNYRMSVICS